MKKKLFSLKIVLISGFLLPPLAISLLTYLGILTVIEPTIESQNAELLKGRLETFASSIEQDIANGFYPSIVQKSKLVYEAAKLGKLSVQLTDGQIVYSEKSESLTGHDQGKYRSIKVPITQIGSDQVSAEIHASVNVEPSHDYALRLRELLSIIAVLGGFIGAFVGLCVSLLIWFPLRRLIRAADGEGPEALSRYAKRSVFREIHALENALSGMGSRIVDLMEAQRRNERDVAIAGLTQMLAHDVRKPFSMLKTGLGMLQAASNDPQKFKSSLSLLISEVERATKSVDGMLADVMEIGSPSQELIQEAVSPDSLIESTLGEIFRVYPQAQISIAYELKHTNMVSVHVKKINRLFANFVGNALQAMNYSGNIWFKTETKGSFVQFCIGNEGSYIAQENISKLFEAFFTSGKKTGTGLGLAIAQKVVHAHGGAIWCHSSKSPSHPRGLVEFYFTLPAAPHTKLLTTAHLPRHSTEITRMLALLKRDAQESLTASDTRSGNALHNNKSSGNGTDGITLKNVPYDLFQTELLHLEPLQQELIQRAHSLAMPLEILLVDDETIYRTALASWIEDSTELRSLCRIHHAVGSAQALAVI